MEAHNCEHAGVHVPCEIVMRLGDLGAQYVWERASFSTLRIGMIGYQSHGLRVTGRYIPFSRLYFRTCALYLTKIGADRCRPNTSEPRGLWKIMEISDLSVWKNR